MKKTILILLFINSTFIYTQITPAWNNIYTPPDSGWYGGTEMIKDNNDNIYATGFSAFYPYNSGKNEIITFKINSQGAREWTKRSSEVVPDSFLTPIGIKLDQNNNVFVVGTSRKNDFQIFIIKFNSAGNVIWSNFYKFSNLPTLPFDFTIDNAANLYICGGYGIEYNFFFTAKFNSSGVHQWTREQFGQSTPNRAFAITIDNTGNIYTTGFISQLNTGKDMLTVKYNSSGTLQWADTIYQVNIDIDDIGYDIISDAQNNLYITGEAGNLNNNDTTNTALFKYNSNGALLWQGIHVTSNIGRDHGKKLILDGLNNIYIDALSDYDVCILKYDMNGIFQWLYRHPSQPFSYQDNVTGMIVDNSNSLIISGIIAGYNRNDMTLFKFTHEGSLQWQKKVTLNLNQNEYPSGLVFSQPDKIFFTGNSGKNFFAMKLLPGNPAYIQNNRNNINKVISDNQYTYDTIHFDTESLPSEVYIKDITVTIDTILHTATGDLDISLIHQGVEDTIIYRRGGPFDNFLNTNLNDTCSVTICGSNNSPFSGYYRPCHPLFQFNSLPVSGPWILKIYDRRPPDTGILKAWSLKLTYESIIGITQISSEVPSVFLLSQNYPNPFNPSTRIKFSIPKSSQVKLVIYDILGKEVSTLVNNTIKAGIYETDFNASNLASGIYFYKLITEDYSETKKMILIK